MMDLVKKYVLRLPQGIVTVEKDELLPVMDAYRKVCNFDAVIPISAKTGDGAEPILWLAALALCAGGLMMLRRRREQ